MASSLRRLNRRELFTSGGLIAGLIALALAGRAAIVPGRRNRGQKLCIPIYTDPLNDGTHYTQAAWLRAATNSPIGSCFIGNVGVSPFDKTAGGPGPTTVSTIVPVAISVGPNTVAPRDMANIFEGIRLVIVDDMIPTSYEVVVVTAVHGPTFAATFTRPHGVNSRLLSQTVAQAYQALHQFSITELHRLGKFEIGYVDSDSALRPLAMVKGDIDLWWNSYEPRIDGIFVDQVNATSDQLNYYRDIYDHIKGKSPALQVWFNPGVQPTEGYMAICDKVMNFESDGAAYDAYAAPPWNMNYPAASFMHIVTSTGVPMTIVEMRRHLANSRRRNCGYFYATPEVDPPTFDGEPSSLQWAAPAAFYMALQAAVGLPDV